MPSHKQKRKLLKYFDQSIRKHPNRPKIISEGDSWFSFPIHANTIDWLDTFSKRKISLLRLEANGDKALRMADGKQKARLAELMNRYQPDALLFSAGGNDVVGSDLLPLLRRKTGSMTWQECIHKTNAKLRMYRTESAYRDIAWLRDANAPNCRLYIHGYDYAIPSGKKAKLWGLSVGPWMKNYLELMDIDDPDDQRKIIRWLMDRFNEMLTKIEKLPNVAYVRTVGTLDPNKDWNDELHPTRKGFEKIAKKFRVHLDQQFPGVFFN